MADNEATPSRKPRWQDMVFTVGSGFFTLALVPALFLESTRIPIWTSAPTAAFLYLFAVTKWNLDLRFAAVSEAITGTTWVLVAVLRH